MTFEQILEMDDDEEEREFSKSIVFGFFEQAEQTFEEMKDALFVSPFLFRSCFFVSLVHLPTCPLTPLLHPSNRRINAEFVKKNTN
jgi:hypothetical protein